MITVSKNKRIKVTVNGRELEVYDELTILQALIQEDVHVPHLCYDIRLDRANGNCGLCVVELVEGNDKVDYVVAYNNRVIALEVKSGKTGKLSGLGAFDKKFKPEKSLLIGDAGIHWQEFLQMNVLDLF